MSSDPRSTSKARHLPISRGRRAIGPPPATRPTPTSHCDRTAFSRLAKLMSQASAISLRSEERRVGKECRARGSPEASEDDIGKAGTGGGGREDAVDGSPRL